MAGGRALRELVVLVALLPVLAGCTLAGATHYLPADTTADPLRAVRARAEAFYEAGTKHEQQGNWKQALNDYQQAKLWDPESRRDIQDAVSRMQARVAAMGPPAPNAAPTPSEAPSAQASSDPPTPSTTAAVSSSQAGMREFHSPSLPYTIAYPQDWLAKQAGTRQQPIDTFVGQPARDVAAVVMITSESVDGGTTLEEVSAATVSQLKAAGINDVQTAERRTVGGLPAYVLSYYVKDDSGTAAARHAILVTPGRAWHVVLLATPGTTPELLKTFDAMLDSLHLLSPAFPQA